MKLDPGSKLAKAQIANMWAKITIKRWRKKLRAMRIGDTKELYRSFTKNVIGAANGDVMKIDFAFHYYGKFVDMGVGRGTSISGVKENRTARRLEGRMLGNRRRPKKWYSKTFYAESKRLVEIMGEHYSDLGSVTITENIDDNSIKK